MKKIIVIFALFLIALECFAWKKTLGESETGDEVISYTKKIGNYQFTYDINELIKSEYLLIENKLYKYRIIKGTYNNKHVAFYRKFNSDFELIETTNEEFIAEIKNIKIKERLQKFNDEITKKVIYIIDNL